MHQILSVLSCSNTSHSRNSPLSPELLLAPFYWISTIACKQISPNAADIVPLWFFFNLIFFSPNAWQDIYICRATSFIPLSFYFYLSVTFSTKSSLATIYSCTSIQNFLSSFSASYNVKIFTYFFILFPSDNLLVFCLSSLE